MNVHQKKRNRNEAVFYQEPLTCELNYVYDVFQHGKLRSMLIHKIS